MVRDLGLISSCVLRRQEPGGCFFKIWGSIRTATDSAAFVRLTRAYFERCMTDLQKVDKILT